MAAFAGPIGALVIAGARNHTNAWDTTNTGVQLATGDALEVHLGGFPQQVTEYLKNNSFGYMWPLPGTTGNRIVAGQFKVNGMYYCPALMRLIGQLFGAETTTQLGATAAYTHLFTMATDSDIQGAWAYFDGLLCHDFPMWKTTAIDIEWEGMKPPVVTITGLGKLELVDGSGSNTVSTLTTALVTFPAQPAKKYPIMAAADFTARLNDASGAALDSTNSIAHMTKCKIRIARVNDQRITGETAPYLARPTVNGTHELSVGFMFDKVSAAAEWTRYVELTPAKASVNFQGTLIASTYYYNWLFEFPNLRPSPTSLFKIAGAGRTPYEASFMVEQATANPTGMAFTVPRFTATDIVTANHLTNGV